MAGQESATYEKELAAYLQERIKPGLNRGSIPLLARSIAKEIAHREHPNGQSAEAEAEPDKEPSGESEEQEPTADAESDEAPAADAESEEEADGESDEEPSAESEEEADGESDEEPSGESDEEPSAESDDKAGEQDETPPDFEADMHDLQAELGDEWTLSFSVRGDDAWLTAATDDGSQRVEAQTAAVLTEAVQLIKEGGGRSG